MNRLTPSHDPAAPSNDPETPSPPDPAELADAGPFPAVVGTLDRAVALVRYLRQHCAWDARQTARTLIPHLLEETHETVEAIRADDPEALSGELGDLLLNVAFQLVVAEDADHFTAEQVVQELEAKMIRRHPHLFGLGEPESWEAIKARERAGAEASDDGGEVAAGVLDGLVSGLAPLLRAHRIQERAAGVGFDWEDARGAAAKVREELAEVEEAMAGDDPDHLEDELGDLLFAAVNLVRLAGGHPDPALDRANRKFERRFRALERVAAEEQVALPGATLDELDELWEQVKAVERARGKRDESGPGIGADPDGEGPAQ